MPEKERVISFVQSYYYFLACSSTLFLKCFLTFRECLFAYTVKNFIDIGGFYLAGGFSRAEVIFPIIWVIEFFLCYVAPPFKIYLRIKFFSLLTWIRKEKIDNRLYATEIRG